MNILHRDRPFIRCSCWRPANTRSYELKDFMLDVPGYEAAEVRVVAVTWVQRLFQLTPDIRPSRRVKGCMYGSHLRDEVAVVTNHKNPEKHRSCEGFSGGGILWIATFWIKSPVVFFDNAINVIYLLLTKPAFLQTYVKISDRDWKNACRLCECSIASLPTTITSSRSALAPCRPASIVSTNCWISHELTLLQTKADCIDRVLDEY